MSLYSTIERRMWGDEKFCALSAPPPNAQDLWIYLLTGPHNSSIPGLFVLGEAALAEAKKWPLRATKECVAEIVAAGMAKFDAATRLWWLPNGLRHNPPKTPNVVRGWRKHLEVIPECALRAEALAGLEQRIATKDASFLEAFEEVIGKRPPKPSPNPSGKPSPKEPPKPLVLPLVKASAFSRARANQEQEQEQEQDQEGGKRADAPAAPPAQSRAPYRERVGALDVFEIGNAFNRGASGVISLQCPSTLLASFVRELNEMRATPEQCERLAAFLAAGGVAHWCRKRTFDVGWFMQKETRLTELITESSDWDGGPLGRGDEDGDDEGEILGPDMGPAWLREKSERFGRG
jgi:hypothetical protein